jgi:hypothetical protein
MASARQQGEHALRLSWIVGLPQHVVVDRHDGVGGEHEVVRAPHVNGARLGRGQPDGHCFRYFAGQPRLVDVGRLDDMRYPQHLKQVAAARRR